MPYYPRYSIDSDLSATSNGEFDHHSPLLPLSLKDTTDYYEESSPALKHKTTTTLTTNSSCNSSKLRRHHKLSSLFKLATWFFVLCWLLVGLSAIVWGGWFFLTRHKAYSKSIFAFPMEPNPLPVEHLVLPFPTSSSSSSLSVNEVQQELDRRYLSLSLPRSTLPCEEISNSSTSRYSSLPSSGPYLIALNLYNSQSVLPTLSRTLLSVSNFLGVSNVHISIFENGSRDNTTLALAHLAAGLTSLGVEHTIVSDPRTTDWKKVDRIDQLAVFRNVALSPITKRAYEDVLFINDVFVGPMDCLELLWQRREQEADAVCAMDWRETKGIFSKLGKNSIKMYDSWVARTLNGNTLRPRLDILSEARNAVSELFNVEEDKPSKERFERGLPIPVYSCWNGMIALTAEPFRTTGVNPRVYDRTGPTLLEGQAMFRPVKQVPKFRSALRSQGECAASECKTLAKDFWSRGYNRWVMIPTVRATYSPWIYTHPHLLSILSRAQQFLNSPSFELERSNRFFQPKIDWSLPEWTAPKSVVCWDWVRGFHIDIEWLRMKRNKPW